jgi:uncharacterized membrane protein
VGRQLAVGLTATAVVWSGLILAAPIALHREATAGPASFLYLSTSRICHQRPERSFSISGFQMPVCARCTGLYLSGALGAVGAWLRRRAPGQRSRTVSSRARPALLLAALPTAVTVALEVLGAARFSNITRTAAAVPLGVVAGYLFVRMLADRPLRYDFRLDAHENPHR